MADLVVEGVQRDIELFAGGAQHPGADTFVNVKLVGHVAPFVGDDLPRQPTLTPSSASIVSAPGASSQSVSGTGDPAASRIRTIAA